MSEKKTNHKRSMRKVLLGHDPGWNDSPKWIYFTGQSSITPTKRVLNKTVAFPMESIQAIDKESSVNKPLKMPPHIQGWIDLLIAPHPPLLCPSNKNIEGNNIEVDKEKTLNKLLKETNQKRSTRKVSFGHDTRWNDSPKWIYYTGQSSITPTKRVLNKTVALPMASIQAVDKECSVNKQLKMPPHIQGWIDLLIAPQPPLLCPSNKDIEGNNIEIDKEETLNNVLKNLETVISEHILENDRIKEVKKRLDILKDVWLEDKLNNVIYKNVLDLSTALREGNIKKADEIHVSLMMQHASLCSAWMPGIRHIILELETKMKNSNVTQSQSSELLLLSTGENK
ncbi:steroid receptor RNA activator 1-like isoform X1 [Bombus pyrosoma]|uniref:steroid receptor RNA activator 1-like isoform X1 n=2 Tax=Bombus pyrosoma TaxID=396416 RepID=UPI001CB98B84|nr:steroid receptor RNA activator 1-like isoform X1 [Bombus pyrosoma]XP_043596956.1 steroid receptor RNA activator 1-like isoform X1 [Bombus pyrosoma]